jgi:hypothetical protein
MAQVISCPQCGHTRNVEKVSTIYLVGIGLKNQAPGNEAPVAPVKYNLVGLDEVERRNLARRLKPPASRRRLQSRPLHPDLIVITFSLIIPFFLYGIYTSQLNTLLPVLGLLAVVYGLYLWKRKAIIARFEGRQAAQRAADERVRQGIQRWMKLYYCADEDIVFTPGSTETLPAERITDIWQG